MGKIGIKTIETSGWKGAIKGMRAPMQSYEKSDSVYYFDQQLNTLCCKIGENDECLMSKLIKGGTEHRKFLRMIHIQAEVSMPRYWWSEYDTYKIGTTANSESTMHKLLNNNNKITFSQFFLGDTQNLKSYTTLRTEIRIKIDKLEILRKKYKEIPYEGNEVDNYLGFISSVEELDKNGLLVLAKRILPECFIQTRVIDLNYETIRIIYNQRKNHRLKEEWQDVFCNWVETLPYFEILLK